MISIPTAEGAYRWQSTGFIRTLVQPEGEIHLWSDKWDGTRKHRGIHDHSFYFRSTILLGQMNAIEYVVELDDDGDYVLWDNLIESMGRCRLIEVRKFTVETGETYEFGGPGRYHDTLKGASLMTYCVPYKIIHEYAGRFVLPLGEKPDFVLARLRGPSQVEMREEVINVYESITDA